MLKTNLAIRQEPFRYEHLHEYNLDTTYVDGKRFYCLENELLPSVTTVLSSITNEHIEEWRKSVGEDVANTIMRRGASRGTLAHKMWEEYLRNDVNFAKGAMPLAVDLFKQLQPWLDKNIDLLYGNEIQLFSRRLRTAGRCDALGLVNGRPAIIDFKTSTRQKTKDKIHNYFLQVTCYAMMVGEMYGMQVDDAYILIAVEEDRPQSFPIRTKHYRQEVEELFTNYHKKQLH